MPTIVRRLIDANPSDGHCYPNLRVLISTGAALFPEDRELALKKITPNIINFYGSAEGSGISALTSAHPPEKSRSLLPYTNYNAVSLSCCTAKRQPII